MALENEIVQIVLEEYQKTYRSWKDIRIVESFRFDLGWFLVVKARVGSEEIEGEICFVDNSLKVTIYATTQELLRDIKLKIDRKWWQKIFTKKGIALVVILILSITLSVLAFKPVEADATIIQILGGAFLTAAGFLFGSSSEK